MSRAEGANTGKLIVRLAFVVETRFSEGRRKFQMANFFGRLGVYNAPLRECQPITGKTGIIPGELTVSSQSRMTQSLRAHGEQSTQI